MPAVRQWNAEIAEGGAYLFVTPGGATIRIDGRTYHATGPKVLSREEAGPLLNATFSPLQRAGTRMLGVRQFLRLHAMPAGS